MDQFDRSAERTVLTAASIRESREVVLQSLMPVLGSGRVGPSIFIGLMALPMRPLDLEVNLHQSAARVASLQGSVVSLVVQASRQQVRMTRKMLTVKQVAERLSGSEGSMTTPRVAKIREFPISSSAESYVSIQISWGSDGQQAD